MAIGDHQRIVAAHSRVRRPIDMWPRHEKFIHIIGVQFNQPRYQPAAFAVNALRQLTGALRNAANDTVLYLQRTLNHFMFQH
jgi:anti-sigma factor RsiW